MSRASDRATLYRINWALHKQGKHACTRCLTVYDWTHEHFRWVNESKGLLESVCKTCQPSAKPRHVEAPDASRRRRLTRALAKMQ